MKKTLLLLITILSLSTLQAQNKEKIKGSKNVKKETRSIEKVHNIEIEDNITLTLVKGANSNFEIEADDNLHDVIKIETFNDKVRIYTTKKCINYKKLHITFTYNNLLKSITARHKSTVNAFSELDLEDLSINSYDYAETNLNIRSTNLNIFASDKSKSKINVTTTNSNIQTKDSANLEGLINSDNCTLTSLSKSDAIIEGTIKKATISVSGKAKITGKNTICNQVILSATENSECSIYASESFQLTANGTAKTALYGDPKITIIEFKNRVSLLKKDK